MEGERQRERALVEGERESERERERERIQNNDERGIGPSPLSFRRDGGLSPSMADPACALPRPRLWLKTPRGGEE